MSVWHICGPLELERGAGGLQRGDGKGTGPQVGAEGLGHLLWSQGRQPCDPGQRQRVQLSKEQSGSCCLHSEVWENGVSRIWGEEEAGAGVQGVRSLEQLPVEGTVNHQGACGQAVGTGSALQVFGHEFQWDQFLCFHLVTFSCSESLTVDDTMGGLLTRGKDASGMYICGVSGNRASPRPHWSREASCRSDHLSQHLFRFSLPSSLLESSFVQVLIQLLAFTGMNTPAAVDADIQTNQHRPVLWWWLLRSPRVGMGPKLGQ